MDADEVNMALPDQVMIYIDNYVLMLEANGWERKAEAGGGD